MTEFMPATSLRQIASLSDHRGLRLQPEVPVMQWTIDEATGRPVSHWVLAEKPVSAYASLAE